MDYLTGLNAKQQEAVLQTEGPVMVMAGAGSGKTRVLTHRIAYIIDKLGIYPSNILAVTFTNKAAREMKERVEKLLNIDTRQMWISTFHSFCARLLRLEAKELEGYTTNFLILDTDDSLKIIKDLMKQEDLDFIKPQTMQKWISNSKNLKDYVPSTDPYQIRKFELIYHLYEEYLLKNNAMDFDDLLLNTLKLFKNNTKVLEKYQNKFNYILIDEFQDTNHVQFDLVYLLALKCQNIFVVGDQDQSIYSFRGAVVENIDKFRKVFPLTKLILLEENYRSTPEILNLANKVIKQNKMRIDKNLYTNNQEGMAPIYFKAETSYEEVIYVCDKIEQLINNKSHNYTYKDFAIMYRANYLSRGFEDELLKRHIPYEIYGGLSFYSRKEIKDIIAYLRLIINNDDNLALLRIINEPKRKIGNAFIAKLEECQDVSLFKALSLVKASGQGYNNALLFRDMIIELGEALDKCNLTDFIDLVLDKTGYKVMLEQAEEEERLENILELKSVIKECDGYYEGDNRAVLTAFLADLALRTDMDDSSEDSLKVKLMTFHQSKGLEFPVVFMVALEEGIFPSQNCYTEKDQEEERRICYVGVTRAEERLYLSSVSRRFIFGQSQSMTPSRFLKEMDLLVKKSTNIIRPVVTSKPEVKASSTSFNINDKVRHKVFGDGLVVKVEGNTLTVAFKAPYGIKIILANHPSIAKIEK